MQASLVAALRHVVGSPGALGGKAGAVVEAEDGAVAGVEGEGAAVDAEAAPCEMAAGEDEEPSPPPEEHAASAANDPPSQMIAIPTLRAMISASGRGRSTVRSATDMSRDRPQRRQQRQRGERPIMDRNATSEVDHGSTACEDGLLAAERRRPRASSNA
jgi:hypothetical protein